MELMLPLVLEARAEVFQSFSGVVRVRIVDPEGGAQEWTVRSGARPWIVRGAATGPADIGVEMTSDLVLRALGDKVSDLQAEMEAGRLSVSGDPAQLQRLGQVLDGVQGQLHTIRSST